MKLKSFLVATLAACLIILSAQLSLSTGVTAAPVVDLIDVETYYQGTYEIPGDPNKTLGSWIEFTFSSSGYVFVGIYDWDQNAWIKYWMGQLSSGGWLWRPSWTFKGTPDGYDVFAYYWDGSKWIFSDAAYGFLQADTEAHGVFGWSPNDYTTAWRGDYNQDFAYYYQFFWYWDNSYYGQTQGSNRLNLLKDRTKSPGGQLQIEYRRNREGWDAAYASPVWPSIYIYGWGSNAPGATVGPTTMEENDIPNPLGTDEEAEIVIKETRNMNVVTGRDPTNTWQKAYWTYFFFYRKPSYRGQSVKLDIEFELKESAIDEPPFGGFFDIIVPTSQNENF